jgi:glycosyltransferase involved in cell wall biosynthesis
MLLSHPTQFEGPLFQYIAAHRGSLTVLYLRADESMSVFDPEINRTVNWGIDLLAGYQYKRIPAKGRMRWLWRERAPSRYDCVIINGYSRLVYVMALLVARLRGIGTALRIDAVWFGKPPFWRAKLKRIAYALLFRLYDHFFAAGSLTMRYLRGFGVPQSRISRFPYTVDTESFASRAAALAPARDAIRAALKIPVRSRVVLVVAKLSAREAPWDLLKALAGLPLEDVWTVVAGDGDQRAALERHAREHGLPRILFTGYVPYTELTSMYVAADVFVHAASYEPWGVSIHEAIACNLPVVASSKVGAAYDLIRSGENGFMYVAGDAADLREKLLLCLRELDRGAITRANRLVLREWNYASTWTAISDGCARCARY